jgi:hypothetical protein
MTKMTALSAAVGPRSEELGVWLTICSLGLLDHEICTLIVVIIAWWLQRGKWEN